jgi:hypothetical protein
MIFPIDNPLGPLLGGLWPAFFVRASGLMVNGDAFFNGTGNSI